jgi:hypothetical protein
MCGVCVAGSSFYGIFLNLKRKRKRKRKLKKFKKNNTRDSNVVPHRSTNRARRCLTSLSRREAVLSSWYGRSCLVHNFQNTYTWR